MRKKNGAFLKECDQNFHDSNMGRTYSCDILRKLYYQGTPERSKWVQEAGKKVFEQNDQKKMRLQTEKNITFYKIKNGLNGALRRAFKNLIKDFPANR